MIKLLHAFPGGAECVRGSRALQCANTTFCAALSSQHGPAIHSTALKLNLVYQHSNRISTHLPAADLQERHEYQNFHFVNVIEKFLTTVMTNLLSIHDFPRNYCANLPE